MDPHQRGDWATVHVCHPCVWDTAWPFLPIQERTHLKLKAPSFETCQQNMKAVCHETVECGLHRSWQAEEQATSPWRPKLGTSIKQPQRLCCMMLHAVDASTHRILEGNQEDISWHSNQGLRPSPISSPSDEYPSMRRLKCWRQRCVK